jgi:hypothetical protein
MPLYHPRTTRKQKANELMRLVAKGPASFMDDPALAQSYRLWSSSWLLPLIVELVPELRGRDDWQVASSAPQPYLKGKE